MGCLLATKDLAVSFITREGAVKAVSGVDLAIKKGEIMGLVGETGCGKSVLGLAIMGLLPANAEVKGTVTYKGLNINGLPEKEIKRIRGKEIALIPQSPSASLNPVLKIGVQVAEVLHLHQQLPWKKAHQAAIEMLRSFDLPEPDKRAEEYPHQLSGGMKQRVLAAMGIAGEPSLLIADEPTKGLDALIRVQVVDIFRQLALKTSVSMLLITHDLKVASLLCHNIAVMYAGEIIELGPTKEILHAPRHPYTKGLLASLPANGLVPIKGISPSLLELPAGCKFHPRCELATLNCTKMHPRLHIVADSCKVRCYCNDQSCKPEKNLFHGSFQKEAG